MRWGLALFVRYLEKIGISRRIEELFGLMRKSAKGLGITKIFKPKLSDFLPTIKKHVGTRKEGVTPTGVSVPRKRKPKYSLAQVQSDSRGAKKEGIEA